MSLDEDEVKAVWLLRVQGLGEDVIEAMSAVLFERLTLPQLTEYLRLLRDVLAVDGVTGMSPQQMYDLAVTAVFSTTEGI